MQTLDKSVHNEKIKDIDFSQPFKLCIQNSSNNIIEIKNGSDKNAVITAAQNGKTGKIEKIDLSKNFLYWSSELGGEIASDLLADTDGIFVITKISKEISPNIEDSGNLKPSQTKNELILWNLDAETGLTKWQIPLGSDEQRNLTGYQSKLVLTSKNGYVTVINKLDGQILWNKRLAQDINRGPVFNDKTAYFTAAENLIVAASIADGTIVSKIPTTNSPQTVLALPAGEIFWGDKKGIVSRTGSTSAAGMRIRQFGGEISALTLVPGGILVSSFDNFIYLISAKKGKTLWKRRLNGRILTEPLISDDFAVIVTNSDNQAVIIDLKDGKLANQISFADRGIISGPPLIADSSLIFATNKGIFAFKTSEEQCFVQK